MNKREIELKKIITNKVHGSSELYNLIIQHYLKNSDDIDYLAEASKRIKKYLSHFPIIINFINDFDTLLKDSNKHNLKSTLPSFLINKTEAYKRIFKKAKNSIKNTKTVITLSHSKTLIEIFKLWKKFNPDLKVIVCESRPMDEGILMAEELLKLKIKTEIITEAMSGKIIKYADAVVLGADQILSNGNIINKTGSRILAITARYQKIPVYVFSTSDKKVKKRTSKESVIDNNKIKLPNNKKIKFINADFEEIENKLITKIFSD